MTGMMVSKQRVKRLFALTFKERYNWDDGEQTER